jgi:type II secretory pathway pseudopilin PulG
MMRCFRNEKGFTILEGLVGLMVTGLLVTLVFKYHVHQNQAYNAQGQISFLQKDVRSAMEALEDEIRMTGSGFPEGALASAITLIDGGGMQSETQTYPDELTISRVVPGVEARLTQDMTSPSDMITVDKMTGFQEGWALISDALGSELFLITDVQPSDKHLFHDTMDLSRAYHTGSRLFQVTSRHFFIDGESDPDHPRLMVRKSDDSEQIIAENIEDVQFYYILENHTETTVLPADIDDLIMVRIEIVGRTGTPDQYYSEDTCKRRRLGTRVQLRNYHLRKGL